MRLLLTKQFKKLFGDGLAVGLIFLAVSELLHIHWQLWLLFLVSLAGIVLGNLLQHSPFNQKKFIAFLAEAIILTLVVNFGQKVQNVPIWNLGLLVIILAYILLQTGYRIHYLQFDSNWRLEDQATLIYVLIVGTAFLFPTTELTIRILEVSTILIIATYMVAAFLISQSFNRDYKAGRTYHRLKVKRGQQKSLRDQWGHIVLSFETTRPHHLFIEWLLQNQTWIIVDNIFENNDTQEKTTEITLKSRSLTISITLLYVDTDAVCILSEMTRGE